MVRLTENEMTAFREGVGFPPLNLQGPESSYEGFCRLNRVCSLERERETEKACLPHHVAGHAAVRSLLSLLSVF